MASSTIPDGQWEIQPAQPMVCREDNMVISTILDSQWEIHPAQPMVCAIKNILFFYR